MNKVYIYGDSHSGRMANIAFDVAVKNGLTNTTYSTCSSNYFNRVVDSIDEFNNKIYHTMSSNLFRMTFPSADITIASSPGRSALNLDYNFYDFTQSWDSDSSIIMPWFGYIDIKNWLPQKNLKNYKNVDEVVDIYVNKTLNNFTKSRVIFINPMPQFEVLISARWANFSSDPAIEFEDRHSTHLEFSKSLKEKCRSVDIEDPINISEILNAEWITTSMQFKKPIQELYNDHLRPEFYKNIFNSILNRIGI